MSKHVPPPRGEPVSSPELNLAIQTAQREKALKRLRKLRKKAADELIGCWTFSTSAILIRTIAFPPKVIFCGRGEGGHTHMIPPI